MKWGYEGSHVLVTSIGVFSILGLVWTRFLINFTIGKCLVVHFKAHVRQICLRSAYYIFGSDFSILLLWKRIPSIEDPQMRRSPFMSSSILIDLSASLKNTHQSYFLRSRSADSVVQVDSVTTLVSLETNRRHVREDQWVHSSRSSLWCQLIPWGTWDLPSASIDIDSIVASASELSSIVLMLSSVVITALAACPSHFLACFWSERGYKKRMLPHRHGKNPFVSRLTWLIVPSLNWTLTSSWCFRLTWFCISDRLGKVIQHLRQTKLSMTIECDDIQVEWIFFSKWIN